MLETSFKTAYYAELSSFGSGTPELNLEAPGSNARRIEVTVSPDKGEIWTGSFSSPDPGWKSLSALLSTPSPECLLIVERGTAFFGNVLDPSSFYFLDLRDTIVDSKAYIDKSILLLIGHFTVSLIGKRGPQWVSEDLSMEGEVRIDEIKQQLIVGTADFGGPEP